LADIFFFCCSCWWPIAGTGRLSLHSFGIAVDLGGPRADYRLWGARANDGRFAWRRAASTGRSSKSSSGTASSGGGKWHHYDTMHFEYRPELFLAPSAD
jgi:hypothetical protein